MARANCPLCYGMGSRIIKCHSFNPALGHPLALVWCDCVIAEIEEAKRLWREDRNTKGGV